MRTPQRYRNAHGQLLEHSPFCERDIRTPDSLPVHDEPGEFPILVKKNNAFHRVVLAHHPTTPVRRPEVLGPDYWRGGNLVRAFQAAGAEYLPATSVWAAARRDDGAFDLGVTGGRRTARVAETFAARALVIATGTLERPFPVPGWTLHGVVTAGGVQALLKSAAPVPEGRVVFAGSGPLLSQVAWQCLNAGGRIERVLETIPRGRLAEAMRHAPGFMFSGYLARGLELVRAVRRRTRVVEHVEALEARGEGRVERVRDPQRGAPDAQMN